ncbi:aspartic peptidase domain-containing protein [Mycena albidolilacea]|uniref:Aspartic peptidase domain-containing protein n=1 Tax=Mycena albidolilacea TaxID=1033008 RepID=A0AAD7AEI1_9AGAR|nr:aspartic peptidase domain-containing protein [Mycena albidolilacea]
MSKRAVAPPQTLVIPVSLDANQVYSVTVNMSSNPAPQSFAFALTTSTAITTVAGANCDSCGGVPAYNPSISSSVQQLPQSQNVSTLNGAAIGTLMRENCGLLQSNGSAWSYPNQTVTVANQSTSFFPSGVSGMIGMGLAPFADSPAAGWLSRNPAQPAFSYGMALNPPSASNSSGSGGELHWLQPDASFYEGEVTWKTMVTANASNPANMSTWFVEMDAFSVSGPPGFNISQSGTQLPTFLDPFYADIVFPQSAARAIYADIPGASKHSTSAFAHAWKLPCDSKFRLTVTFGTFSASLDQSALVVKQADGVCVGVLQEWIDAKATQYLLGSPFIAVLYLIFSFSQSGDGTMGVAARAAKDNKLAPGAIAGVVLGTLAVVALIVIAGVLLYFAWQRRSRVPRRRKPSKTEITPFTDISPTTSRSSQHLSSGAGDQRGLLASLPGSPDWATTFISDGGSPNSNIFPGGTTFTESHTSRQFLDPNSNSNMNSSTSLIHLESPPPYANPNGLGPPPVPLVPLRKTRNRS